MEQAFSLLLSGMFTIFVILTLVVLTGNGLIRLSNRFFSAEEEYEATAKEQIQKGTLAAIVATVDIVTGGKGTVTKIRKQKP